MLIVLGLPGVDRACAGGRASAGPDALRGLHHGKENRAHGGARQCAGDSPLLVVGPADGSFPAPQCFPAARDVRGVQYLAGAAQPRAGQRAVETRGWLRDGALRARAGRRSG